MTREETRAVWAGRVEAQQASGVSAAAWCAAQDIPLQAFYHWRRRLAEGTPPSSAPHWVAVAPAGSVERVAPAEQAALTLRVGGVTIAVAAGFDPRVLAAVLTVLEGR